MASANFLRFLVALLLFLLTYARPHALFLESNSSAASILSNSCTYNSPDFVCIDRYGSSMRAGFGRNVSLDIDSPDKFTDTFIPDDSSFDQISKATFLIWDNEKAASVLGSSPQFQYMFNISSAGHEGPVYVPDTNEVYFSQLETGFLQQMVVNLSEAPPTLSQKAGLPPLYAPSGARYRNGSIYFSVVGGNDTMNGSSWRPGIYILDPKSGETKNILNNYYGYYFAGCDDLDIDDQGRIWFTDISYGQNSGLNTQAPQIEPAIYRFDPLTGNVGIVEDTLVAPNGIAFSPDRKTLYISDTGAAAPDVDPRLPPQDVPGLSYNATGKRTVYAYDVSPNGLHIFNKRPIFFSMESVPDGVKVAQNGYLILGTGHGVDVIDPDGTPVLRINTDFLAVNMAFAGPNMDELWIVGHGGVARVKWALQGVA